MTILHKINNLEISEDKYSSNGYAVTVRNPVTNSGVGMHLQYVTPEDLRKLADFLENNKPT